MSLRDLARATLAICERGRYLAAAGEVEIDVVSAREGTVLYAPGPIAFESHANHGTEIAVRAETTAAAARRLGGDVALLNFASARNVGGGFLNGARAQEEDLCRKSALYACLETQRRYYDANRAEPSALYTDHLIYSPRVPFFRDEDLELLSTPYVASVVTAPAPNAGALRTGRKRALLRETFVRRIDRVLSLFAKHGHTRVVLGAWGCGAFQNDPVLVARLFRDALDVAFAGVFEEVVFAIYDRQRGTPCLSAFRAQFEPS